MLDALARQHPPPAKTHAWDHLASALVGALRARAGQYPHDRELHGLIHELSTRSEAFRGLWAAHNVRLHRTGRKRMLHPIVGELDLLYETLTLEADDGLRLNLFTADAGSRSDHALDVLSGRTADTTEWP